MRCFVAAFVAAESARRLQTLARRRLAGLLEAGSLRLVPLANLHVTVWFLGDIDTATAVRIETAVADLNADTTLAAVAGIGGFPQPSAARVVAAELAPQPELAAWRRALVSEFRASLRGGPEGLREAERYRPHVTLARNRRPVCLPQRPVSVSLQLRLNPPVLYRSDPSPTGVRYRPVALS